VARPSGEAGEIKEDIDGRDEWFWGQRTYPFAERPYGKMADLYNALRARPSLFASSSAAAPLTGSWRPIGPNGLWVALLETGRVAAILPATKPGGPMYVGTASGGVWRSTDNGVTWTALTDRECGLATGAMALDPANPAIVYAATGEGNGGLNGCGVLRSGDGGATWSTGVTGLKSTTGAAGPFLSLIVDPATAGSASSSILIGATLFSNAGIVRSVNSGASWTPVLNTGPASSIVAHPTKPGTFYAGDRVSTPATSRGVYRSTDVGQTWSILPPLPVTDANSVGRVEVAMSKAAPGTVFALVGDRNSGSFLALFKFDEASSTWTQLPASGITNSVFGSQQTYDLVLAVDPSDPQRIYVAGVRAFRSLDGGATFQPMAQDVHVDWHVIVFDPNDPTILWAGTDGGVYLSTDGGDSWSSRSAGLAITQFYPGVSVNPQGTRISGGSQDNGTHVFTGTPFWDAFLGGDGGYTAINYLNPNVHWAETQWSAGTAANLFRQDGVLPAQRRSAGISTNDRAQFIPPLVMDPVNPSKLYFGTFRLYQTTNEGVSWTALGGDLTSGSGTITSISVSPADTMTIYVGTSDGRALASRDGGVTFAAATGLPNRFVTRVMAHPTDPLRALVTVSSFGTGHVFETNTAFASVVRDISGNLIDAPANVAIYMPSASAIVAGTDAGVFQSIDGGISWTTGPAGMPNVIVYDLVYQPAIGLLVAGTYGRGMFAYDVGAQTATLRGDVNGDGKIDAADALLIQQALVGLLPASTAIYPRGDANCNGSIDAADVVLVLRTAVGLPTTGACVGTTK
jgi:photosystem II stability/assembly factor-like uncharacterized protein